MNTEQKTEEVKSSLPSHITPQLIQLKVNVELVKRKITLSDLQNRALTFVKNRDNLKLAADFFKDTKAIRDVAEEIHKVEKKPYLDGGRVCDAGKKLVLDEADRLDGMIKPWYDKELSAIAVENRDKELKKAKDEAILKGIEDNVITFSNMVVAATTKKALLDVESRINLEKSPLREKKYGEFHAQAIARYDSILIPIIKDQKTKIEELEKLNTQLLEAEAHNDPEKMDELMAKVDEKSNEILQNNAVVQEAALNQESFPVIEATEVLPEFKTKRTNFSYEIADLEVALKKSRQLLEISIDSKAAKLVKDKLVEEGAFEGKDEVIRDGIKYIATRVREAL